MDSSAEKVDVYGRLDVSVPEAVYEAGRVSTVTILIRNPFNEPVEILNIQGPRSSHLSEIVRDFRVASKDSITNPQQPRRRNNWFRKFLESLRKIQITEIRFGGLYAEFPRARNVLNISTEPNSETEINTDISNYENINIHVSEGAKVKFSPQINTLIPEDRKSIIIEPHCEAVAYFDISTLGWLFFTPTRRSLSTLVKYRVNGKEKTQVVMSEFDVRPPLLSMVIGSILGSLLGALAKILNTVQSFDWQPMLVSLGASVVMSLIATIALSRKTGTQGFITVEDFFGGFVVGALIGYGGSTYFERAIIPSNPTNPSSSTP